MAVSPSRVPSCKSVQGLPDTSAFSLRGTCERTPSHPDVVAITPCLQPPRCHSAFPLGSLSPIILALRPPASVCHRLTTRVSRLASVYPRHNNCLLPLERPLHCTAPYCSPFLDGSYAANDHWETRCSWETVDSMNSTNTIRILIRPVAFLVC